MEYKVVLGTIAIVIAIIGYIPYFKDIYIGKTKPHAYSWLIWTILTGIAFVGQTTDKAGAGAWVTGVTSLACLTIFCLALKRGEKNVTTSDKLSLCGAGIALLLWYVTSSPLWSIILVTIITVLGYYPTMRKSYRKPYEETMATYIMHVIKFVIGIIALQNYTIITISYPAALILMNVSFVGFLINRRAAQS